MKFNIILTQFNIIINGHKSYYQLNLQDHFKYHKIKDWTLYEGWEKNCYILNLYFIIIFKSKNLKAEIKNTTFCIAHVNWFWAFCLKISLVIGVPELLQLRTKFRSPWSMWETLMILLFFLGEMNLTQTLSTISLYLCRFGKHLTVF